MILYTISALLFFILNGFRAFANGWDILRMSQGHKTLLRMPESLLRMSQVPIELLRMFVVCSQLLRISEKLILAFAHVQSLKIRQIT